MKRNNIYDIMHYLSNIPFYIENKNGETIDFMKLIIPSKIKKLIKGNRKQIIMSLSSSTISQLDDNSNLSYIGLIVDKDYVVVGPFLKREMTLNQTFQLKKRLRLIGEEAILCDNMFHQLRVLNVSEIELIYHIIKTFNNEHETTLEYKKLSTMPVKNVVEIDPHSLFQEYEFVKRNYKIENLYLQIVQRGDVKAAKTFMTQEIMTNLPERARNDSLRNAKTRLTIMNTLCNRAAINGGINVQLGHQISTNLGIQIERMDSIIDANRFMKNILVAYTESVRDYAIKDYSTLIKNAIFYIREHITTPVSLQNIANFLFVSKEHLSREFKKETGIQVSKYIQKAKVVEAKTLLKNHNHSVSDISIMLGFANSSHFSNMFKTHTGMTPKEYQSNYDK
ncbi:MAG: helix-turn-helix domain-containing protein [Candidatus Izemoplasmataceae bacterium]